MIYQTGLLDRSHPVVLWLCREEFHNFLSQPIFILNQLHGLHASNNLCIWLRI